MIMISWAKELLSGIYWNVQDKLQEVILQMVFIKKLKT